MTASDETNSAEKIAVETTSVATDATEANPVETNLDETNQVETSSGEPNPIETNTPSTAPASPEVQAPVEAVAPHRAEASPPSQAPAIVVVQSVTARDVSGPKGRARGTLNAVSLSLGTGVFAFVGAPEDGTFALLDLLSGARAPMRGRVSVAGGSPVRQGNIRARIGVLSPEPALPSAGSVHELVVFAQQARGQTQPRAADVLAPLGLEHLASRSPRSLSFAETRAVELALALSTPSPLLLVLHEPLHDMATNLLGLVRERIRQIAATGACVVVTTSSPADARALADEVFLLQRGSVVASGATLASAAPQAAPLLVAWVRPAERADGLAPIRQLARALAERPEIVSVAWSNQPAPASHLAELRLSGSDLDACALALADAATEVGAVIEAIAPASPGLTRLRAAVETSEALRRAAAHQRPATTVGGAG